jgi:hypothetical protein
MPRDQALGNLDGIKKKTKKNLGFSLVPEKGQLKSF